MTATEEEAVSSRPTSAWVSRRKTRERERTARRSSFHPAHTSKSTSAVRIVVYDSGTYRSLRQPYESSQSMTAVHIIAVYDSGSYLVVHDGGIYRVVIPSGRRDRGLRELKPMAVVEIEDSRRTSIPTVSRHRRHARASGRCSATRCAVMTSCATNLAMAWRIRSGCVASRPLWVGQPLPRDDGDG